MARQKKEAVQRGEVVEEEKKETKQPPSALKLAPKSAPAPGILFFYSRKTRKEIF
jgi:hypothetical protein